MTAVFTLHDVFPMETMWDGLSPVGGTSGVGGATMPAGRVYRYHSNSLVIGPYPDTMVIFAATSVYVDDTLMINDAPVATGATRVGINTPLYTLPAGDTATVRVREEGGAWAFAAGHLGVIPFGCSLSATQPTEDIVYDVPQNDTLPPAVVPGLTAFIDEIDGTNWWSVTIDTGVSPPAAARAAATPITHDLSASKWEWSKVDQLHYGIRAGGSPSVVSYDGVSATAVAAVTGSAVASGAVSLSMVIHPTTNTAYLFGYQPNGGILGKSVDFVAYSLNLATGATAVAKNWGDAVAFGYNTVGSSSAMSADGTSVWALAGDQPTAGNKAWLVEITLSDWSISEKGEVGTSRMITDNTGMALRGGVLYGFWIDSLVDNGRLEEISMVDGTVTDLGLLQYAEASDSTWRIEGMSSKVLP